MTQELPLIARARAHAAAIALRTGADAQSYSNLLDQSAQIAAALLGSSSDLQEARIAFLMPAGFEYIAAQWGIWRAGGIAVPLSLSATSAELEYVLTDTQAACVVVTREFADKVLPLCLQSKLRVLIADEIASGTGLVLPRVTLERRALILYTSGTTAKPKGVVSSHANICAQIEALVTAWQWRDSDRIPLFLPLHHIHGIINILSCALWVGATIEPFAQFDLPVILQRVAQEAYSVFMAVPTIYVKIIHALRALPECERVAVVRGFAKMRLMVSGSSALPANIHAEWLALTGQKLLERYGMTEIGMVLSHPYDGERRPGTVGQPLPGAQVRLMAETGTLITGENEPGEIQVRGPSVFLEYWNRPQITTESFDQGWFRTGDIAVRENGYYRILGRQSVDIIKSGGYKLSALEIETVLLEHPVIRECAVVGVADETWGEAVAAAIVPHDGQSIDQEALRAWCRNRMSAYKAPKHWRVVESLPRNALGKITKPTVRDLFGSWKPDQRSSRNSAHANTEKT